MLKRVHLHIHTKRVGINASFFELAATAKSLLRLKQVLEEVPKAEEPEEIDQHWDARLRITDKSYTLVYDEDGKWGMEGTTIQYTFFLNNPECLYLFRTGLVDTTFVFEEGKQHFCSYRTFLMPFEVCIYTLKISNKLLTEGKLTIDYVVEIHGAQAERCSLTVEVKEERPRIGIKGEN